MSMSPEQSAAREAVRSAIKRGDLVRPASCELCSKACTPVAHHHEGYAPEVRLTVQWLCRGCHIKVHVNVTIAERYTREEQTEFRMRGLNARTPEKIAADSHRAGKASIAAGGGFGVGWAKLSPEERSERARRVRMEDSAERRAEISRQAAETKRTRIASGVVYKPTRVVADQVGKRFGRLVVIERGPDTASGSKRWLCQCDCGEKVLIRIRRTDMQQSCGCYRSERMRTIDRTSWAKPKTKVVSCR